MEDRLSLLMADALLTQYTKDIRALIRNSIRITCNQASESDFRIGQSKIGGLPDLPSEIEWPTWLPPRDPRRPGLFARLILKKVPPPEEPQITHLSFIAQFNLSEIASYDTERALPGHGMLYFFYDATDMVWFEDVPIKDGWRVLYWDGDISTLKRADAPQDLSSKLIYGAFLPTFVSERMLPPSESLLLRRLGMTEDEISRYAGVHEDMASDFDDTISRLLGYPDYIQFTDMLTECELAANGMPTNYFEKFPDDARMDNMLENTTRWQLLFQMDSQHLNTNWGDAGRIYYFAKSFDMTQRSLEEVQLAFQCS